MKIAERISKIATTSEQLDRLERELDIKLPPSYRLFLETENGGRPDLSFFDFIEKGLGTTRGVVRRFLTADDSNKFYGIQKFIATYNGRLPPKSLPVACDSFGNLVLLKCGGDEYGSVHFWNHEHEGEDPATWEDVSFISGSFDAFTHALHL